ncbi:MAG: hypothetical protein U1E60_09555 [Reyranellaceae bacterium]
MSGIALDDAAGIHDDNPVRDLSGECHFVRHDHHRHAFRRQLPHDFQHAFADEFRIERRRRLVEQRAPGLHGERASDGDHRCCPPESWWG